MGRGSAAGAVRGRALRRLGRLCLATAALSILAAAPASAEEVTKTLRYGPITMAGYQVAWKSNDVETPQLDGFITRMHARIVDAQGRRLPVKRTMLHHVAFLNASRVDDVYCKGGPERFYGTGEENQALTLPPGYGYPVAASDRWRMGWMVMNHRPNVETAYIEYTVTMDTAPDLTPVKPLWLGAVGCLNDPIFNAPGGGAPGSSFYKTRDWTMPVSGRIVAANGHLHGGARKLSLTQPRCENRTLLESQPIYGHPENPVYNVLPVLHEPGPVSTSWFNSGAGIPVTAGEPIKVVADYDGQWPHTRAMGIMHAYLAPEGPPAEPCAPLPDDIRYLQSDTPGRDSPPRVKVPLTGLDARGRARSITRPPGRISNLKSDATIEVRDFEFSRRNVAVPAGATLTWRSFDRPFHNVTVADGPRGYASLNLKRGSVYRQRFTKPGLYKMFCSLHPIAMTQSVTVKKR